MRRSRGCRAGLLVILVALLACLVFASLAAALVLIGDVPLYAPRVVDVEPAPGEPVLPTTSFTLTFDQPMDPESVGAAFSILPAVPGSLDWNAARDEVTFVPAGTGFEPGTRYTLRLYTDARSAIFQRRLARELSRSFLLPPLLIESAPVPDVDVLGAYPKLRAAFSYDLDCSATAQTFTINPRAQGEFVCQQRTLTFRPTAPLAPDTTYQASLAHTFLAGDPVPRAGVSWSFRTAPPLTVTDLLPRPGHLLVDLQQPVRITFNRPVDPDLVVPHLIIASAAGEPVAGQVEWQADGSVLLFRPAVPWLPGAEYLIRLESSAGDRIGFTLQEPLAEQFATLPMLKIPEPMPGAQQVPLSSTIAIPFTRPMDRASVEAGLVFTPALDASYTWDGDTLVVTPRAGLAASTHYTLSVAAASRDASGAPLGSVHSWDLYTEPFLLDARVPSDAPLLSLGMPMTLTFALPMDPASVRSALDISPHTAVDLAWSDDGRTLVLHPETRWRPGERYEIRLSGSAGTTDRAQLMGTDQVWPFVTADSEVRMGLGSNLQVLAEPGPRTFQALHRGADSVEITLYPITPTQLLALYDAGIHGRWMPEQVQVDTAGLASATTWQQHVHMSPLDWHTIAITLPSDVTPGFYAVAAGSRSTATPSPGLLLVVTDHLLAVKRAPRWQEYTATPTLTATTTATIPVTTTPAVTVTGLLTTTPSPEETAGGPTQLLVWDTERATGAPVVSATVQVIGADGSLLAQGITDRQGLFEVTLPAAARPLFVLSDRAGDVSVCGLDPSWSSEPGWYSGPPPPVHTLVTLVDRALVHPGDTIRFRAIVRTGAGSAYILPPQGTGVTAWIEDAQGQLASSQVLTTTAFGTASGALTLPEGSVPGTWYLVTHVAGDRVFTPFQVQPAPAIDYRVTVRTQRPVYVAGEPITVTVSAFDDQAEPVAAAPVELSVHPAYTSTGVSAGALHFEPAIFSQQGTTGDDGRWTVALPSTSFGRLERNALFALAATLHPEGAPEAAAYEVVSLRLAAYHVELLLDQLGYAPGDQITITARVLDRYGLPAAAVPLTATLFDAAGQVVATAGGESGRDGAASFSIAPGEQGRYQAWIVATDEAGNHAADRQWLWVLDPAGEAPWRGGDEPVPQELSIAPDRRSYAAGDQARLAVLAPAAGPALLTVERDRVRAALPVTLDAGTTVLTVPIQAGDEPGVYASLAAWGDLPRGTAAIAGTPARYALHEASAGLSVPAADRQLDITLTPAAESYAPGGRATVHVRVVDAQGAPVRAELSLSVAEALLPPSEGEASGLFSAFYGPQPNRVGTVYSLAPQRQLLPEIPPGPEAGMGLPTPFVLPRALRDTVYWMPALVTDATGLISVTFTLPDEPREWQIVAHAVTTDTQVGTASARLVTTASLSVLPVLPASLVEGEMVTITALVHSYLPQPVSATVTLSAVGLSVVGSPSARQRTIHLPAHRSAIVSWQATAAGPGSADIILGATATYRGARLAGRAAARATLPILPPALPAEPHFTGRLDDLAPAALLTFTLPADTLDLARVDLFLTTSSAPVRYQVYVNDTLWHQDSLPAAAREHLVLTYTETLSPALLIAGHNQLRLVVDGGPVYYTATVTTHLVSAIIAAPFATAATPAFKVRAELTASCPAGLQRRFARCCEAPRAASFATAIDRRFRSATIGCDAFSGQRYPLWCRAHLRARSDRIDTRHITDYN